jgi:hypothetical protein
MGRSGGGNDGGHRTRPGCPWRTWPRSARAAPGSEVEGGGELRDEGAEGERRVALDGVGKHDKHYDAASLQFPSL